LSNNFVPLYSRAIAENPYFYRENHPFRARRNEPYVVWIADFY